MTNPIKDTGNGSYLVKKGFIYAATTFLFLVLAASWSLTWSAATDRTFIIESLKTHGANTFIHNMDDTYIKEKDLTLYFEPIIQRLDGIEKNLDKLNNK